MLLCDNFLSFKKIMVAKNKELEVAAMNAAGDRSAQAKELDEKEL